jgi:hypothetical protein
MWQQESVEGIGIVAAFILALTALESGGFGRRAGEPGVNSEIQRVIERMEAAATVTAADDPSSAVDLTESPADPVAQQAEAERRRAVEVLVKDAAAWGWLKANTGSPTPPEPQIEWDRDGNARILHEDLGTLRRQPRTRRRPAAVERSRRERGAGGPASRA